MAIFQTPEMEKGHFGYNNRYAGQVETHIVTFTFNSDFTAASDIGELCALPAMAKLIEFEYETENLSAGNISFGFMSGKPGSTDATRTCDDSLLAAATRVAGNGRSVGVVALAELTPDASEHRSIGFECSADEAAGATKQVHVKVSYIR